MTSEQRAPLAALPEVERRESAATRAHRQQAEFIRDHAPYWVPVGIPSLTSTAITKARVKAYEPAGSFEAAVRQGVLYARFVGSDWRGMRGAKVEG